MTIIVDQNRWAEGCILHDSRNGHLTLTGMVLAQLGISVQTLTDRIACSEQETALLQSVGLQEKALGEANAVPYFHDLMKSADSIRKQQIVSLLAKAGHEVLFIYDKPDHL